MNYFIGVLVEKMREAGIYTVLVKGQGVGQCYERPLWRSCGDVDLFFDAENYERAKGFLTPLAMEVEPEEKRKKHLADHRRVGGGAARPNADGDFGAHQRGRGAGAE